MKLGDKVKVIHHFVNNLIGLEGYILNERTTLETKQEKELGKIVQRWQIKATNYGEKIKSKISNKERNVFAWIPGNILSVREEDIKIKL